MYLWIGLRLPRKFEKKIRKEVLKINKDYNLDEIAFELTQHITLKISFPCENHEEIIENLKRDVFSDVEPFDVFTEKIEYQPGIIWIKFVKNLLFEKLHNEILDYLRDRYNIQPDPLDEVFVFHTTLIHDEVAEEEKMLKVFEEIKANFVPEPLRLDEIMFGTSDENDPQEYRIVDNYKL